MGQDLEEWGTVHSRLAWANPKLRGDHPPGPSDPRPQNSQSCFVASSWGQERMVEHMEPQKAHRPVLLGQEQPGLYRDNGILSGLVAVGSLDSRELREL